MNPPRRDQPAITQLLEIMAALRSPEGCPWDREQDHTSLRFHAVEEVYELLDAIDQNDTPAMVEELGDVLLQVIFHCQLGRERGTFDFEQVCQGIVDKLVGRHPHVFGSTDAPTVDAVLSQWDRIKSGEKETRRSVFDGIPRHLPALQHAEKLTTKARKAGLLPDAPPLPDPGTLGRQLFDLARAARQHGLSAEALLREEIQRRERDYRSREARGSPDTS